MQHGSLVVVKHMGNSCIGVHFHPLWPLQGRQHAARGGEPCQQKLTSSHSVYYMQHAQWHTGCCERGHVAAGQTLVVAPCRGSAMQHIRCQCLPCSQQWPCRLRTAGYGQRDSPCIAGDDKLGDNIVCVALWDGVAARSSPQMARSVRRLSVDSCASWTSLNEGICSSCRLRSRVSFAIVPAALTPTCLVSRYVRIVSPVNNARGPAPGQSACTQTSSHDVTS